MSGQDVGDVCRQIAAEHADRVARGQAPAAFGGDALAMIGRLDGYAEALHDLSEDLRDATEDSSR